MAILNDHTARSFDVRGTLIDRDSGMLAGLCPLTDPLKNELSDDATLELHARHESVTLAQTTFRLTLLNR